MSRQTQKNMNSTTARIWRKPKERMTKVVEVKSEREGRPVTEAEFVSRAVDALCTKEERKLGIA